MSIFKWTTEPSKIYYWAEMQVSDMKWPCPDGFHVPTKDEWEALYNAGISMGAWTASTSTYLKQYLFMPLNWLRAATGSGGYYNYNNNGYYRSSSRYDAGKAYSMYFNTVNIYPSDNTIYCSFGEAIRPFKDTPVAPDNSGDWTSVYTSWSAGIWRNATLWLLSISSDWTNWITIADKNLWATTLYTDWATLSEANCGYYYQRWNNYWFPWIWAWNVTTSTDKVDASGYWPWNYYSSSTYITAGYTDWSSVENDNLRWWVTQGTYPSWETDIKEVTAVYLWEDKVRPTTPVFEPVWDYALNNTNTTWALSNRSYYWIYVTPKVNCTLNKVQFVANASPIWTIKINAWWMSAAWTTYTLSWISWWVYTLPTPFEMTAWVKYAIWVYWSYNNYYYVNPWFPISWTNVVINASWQSDADQEMTRLVCSIRWVETTQTS